MKGGIKMKKIVLALICVCLFALSSPVLAMDNAVYDTQKIPHKVFSPAALNSANNTSLQVLSAPYWEVLSVWYIDDVGTSTSDSWTSSSKTTRYVIDHIYAKTKVYNRGVIDVTKADDQLNASHAGASARCTSISHIFSDHEVYGAHTFEEAGFQSWYPETYDT